MRHSTWKSITVAMISWICYTRLLLACGRGGTGRRAALRSLWGKLRGSSSLLDRTSSARPRICADFRALSMADADIARLAFWARIMTGLKGAGMPWLGFSYTDAEWVRLETLTDFVSG